ncbi:putative lipoate-protein ligase A isoform X2 [Phalaenopsis equestris]|uniref:putative lipoate-protein ligase A isoform X2 n=1 Tax=Phalaenopsis equestris TaxID=78828 RepID=UPI0009E2D792|nr:putative lipoate-protein ligase A isoform X2 [Phalaenopsis equestris]XP_020575173.1 putative lipoate-protein ligase A isoform X2 [Phalaenopsis equestris]XP_020575174.1 putative lipoate-protein ligase A isoform X2 [Phalaenopsis equestris]XP_020575175.1 putative lipoate-protein ligase A isoform X2 [Phalaenopsis equestris]XP_020575176.1 putative lipoate-protein ligase A isoform X2 [Phalaenopsis equestris]
MKSICGTLRTKEFSILQQLHLEERLLRASSDNWCIINNGTNQPNIVMGISGKPEELVEVELVLQDQVPVIRRFTGGGTVIVDDRTIFVTFICNKNAIPGLQPFPRPIMSWTGQFYKNVFEGYGDFQLCENDYAFGLRKFGGNAQSITKNRWIHHTSFLWDYDVRNMQYLKIPKRAPEYRLARNHTEFLCRMKDYLTSRSIFIERTISSLEDYFSIKSTQLDCVINTNEASQLQTTRLLTKQELE